MTTGHLFHKPTPTPTKPTSKRRKRATATIPPDLVCPGCGGERAVRFRGRAHCPICDQATVWPGEATADPADGEDAGDATCGPYKGTQGNQRELST